MVLPRRERYYISITIDQTSHDTHHCWKDLMKLSWFATGVSLFVAPIVSQTLLLMSDTFEGCIGFSFLTLMWNIAAFVWQNTSPRCSNKPWRESRNNSNSMDDRCVDKWTSQFYPKCRFARMAANRRGRSASLAHYRRQSIRWTSNMTRHRWRVVAIILSQLSKLTWLHAKCKTTTKQVGGTVLV